MNSLADNFETKCDIACEILCLVACKYNKSFPDNSHEKLARKYSLEKLQKTYEILKMM